MIQYKDERQNIRIPLTLLIVLCTLKETCSPSVFVNKKLRAIIMHPGISTRTSVLADRGKGERREGRGKGMREKERGKTGGKK